MTKKLVIIFILSITIVLTRSKRSTITINIQFITIISLVVLIAFIAQVKAMIGERIEVHKR